VSIATAPCLLLTLRDPLVSGHTKQK
jgi:hypothetical protein